jgi:hypothetical protein
MAAFYAASQPYRDLQAAYQGYFANPPTVTLAEYQNAITAYENAVSDINSQMQSLLPLATAYVSALAYKQLLDDQTSAEDIQAVLSSIPTWAGGGTFPDLPGLSGAEKADLDPQLQTIRNNLLNAFNSYRYLEWQIVQERCSIYQTVAANRIAWHRAGIDPNPPKSQAQLDAELIAIQSNVNTLISQRGSKAVSLDAAIQTYSGYFGPNDPLIQRMQTFNANWANYTSNLTAHALAVLQQGYQTAQAEDTSAQAAYYQTVPGYTDFQTEASEVATARAEQMSEVVSLGSVSLTSPSSQIQLPASSFSGMSFWMLASLISKVQLLIQQIDRMTASADAAVAALQFEIAILHLVLLSEQRALLLAWISKVKGSDTAYNDQVEADNANSYHDKATAYNLYANNIDVINNSIDSANSEISTYNNNVQQLINSANAIGPSVIDAINAAKTSKTEVNYLDFLDEDADITSDTSSYVSQTTTPLTTIPHITPADAPPVEMPNEAPSAADFDALNEKINTLMEKIGPVKDAVATAIGEPLNLAYMRQTIDVRDNSALLDTLNDLTNILYTVLLQAIIKRAVSEETASTALGTILTELSSLFEGEGANLALAPGVMQALSTMDLAKSPTEIAQTLNTIFQSKTFVEAIMRVLERAALLAGIYVSGLGPKQKDASEFGIARAEKMDAGVYAILSEEERRKQLLLAFALYLLTAAANGAGLRQTAVLMLENIGPQANLSEDQLKDIISILIKAQQVLCFLVASMAGDASGTLIGITSAVPSSAIGPIGSLVSGIVRIGIPLPSAQILGSVLGDQGTTIQNQLNSIGYSPTAATIMTAFLAASEGNINLAQGVPGGSAYIEALKNKLADEGVVLGERLGSPRFAEELLRKAAKNNAAEQVHLMSLWGKVIESRKGVGAEKTTPMRDRLVDSVQTYRSNLSLTSVSPSFVNASPQDVLKQLNSAFSALPKSVQGELLRTAPKIAGLSPTESASLSLAVRLRRMTPEEASYLTSLASLGAQKSFADVTSAIATKLFRTPQQVIERRQEERKEESIKFDRERTQKRPTTAPPNLLNNIRLSYENLFNSSSDIGNITKVATAHAKTVRSLTDFNRVIMKFLEEPAETIVKNVSILTRKATDRQPPILG